MSNTAPNPAIQPVGRLEAVRDWVVDHKSRFIRATAFATALGAAAVAGCAARGNNEVSTISHDSAAEHVLTLNELNAMPAVYETDASLAHGGYNCGHTVESGQEDFSKQIDYLNGKPQLAKNLRDFNVNDPTWGMGERAWHILISRGVNNSGTPENQKVSAKADTNGEMNKYIHRVREISLDHEVVNVNFTCSDADGNTTKVRAVGKDKITSHLNAIALKDADLMQFVEAFQRAKGQVTVRIVDLGMEMVDGKEVHLNGVVTEATGCENPQRIMPPRINVPGTTPTTTSEVTTVTSAPPNSPPRTFELKTDSSTNVPVNHTPQTTPSPSSLVPDNGERNPVGTTSTIPEAPTSSPGTTVKPPSPTTTAPPPPITQPVG